MQAGRDETVVALRPVGPKRGPTGADQREREKSKQRSDRD